MRGACSFESFSIFGHVATKSLIISRLFSSFCACGVWTACVREFDRVPFKVSEAVDWFNESRLSAY